MTLPDSNAAQFLKQQPKAGDTQPFPSGQITYLAPLPLPTQHPAQDYSHAVGEVTDTYLDFGTGLPQVFGWQVLLGGPFAGFVMITYLLPIIAAVGTEHRTTGDAVCPVEPVDGPSTFAGKRRRGAPVMRKMAVARCLRQLKALK